MPQTLDYLTIAPEDRPPLNVPAAISIACGMAAVCFTVGVCLHVWQHFLPSIGPLSGFIAGGLALSAVINGGIGALRAPRDSTWYRVALIGYASGMLIGSLSPIFFLL
jgi:hypothetical protein